MGGVKNHGCPGFPHDRQSTHVTHQVVITKARATLAGHEAVVVQTSLARRRAGFVDHVLHVMGREELPLFDVHRPARLGDRPDKVGLTAQKGRGLKHIHHRRHGGDLVFGMHVGQHGHLQLAFDFSQNFQTLRLSRPPEAAAARAVGFIKAAFKDKGNAQAARDVLERTGGVHLQLLGFDHTGAGNQKEGLFQTNFKAA